MKLNIVVTGAAGFIGSHLIKKLLNEGHSVLGLDNFSNYYSQEYKILRVKNLEIERDCKIINSNIENYELIERIISRSKPDYIVHLAAQAGVRIPLENTQTYIDSNITGFLNVIRSAIKNNVKGIVYASSSSVYNDKSALPFSEFSTNLSPKSFYGATKLLNERMAEIYAKNYDLKFRGLRFFTVYGPWGRPDMAYFRIAAAALGEYEFSLYGDGNVKRDFTNIDDVAINSVKLLEDLDHRNIGFNDIVNIGGGKPKSMNQLIDEIRKYQDTEIVVNKHSASQLDSEITMASDEYLNSILGSSNFKSLEIGVLELIQWAKLPFVRSKLNSWISSTL